MCVEDPFSQMWSQLLLSKHVAAIIGLRWADTWKTVQKGQHIIFSAIGKNFTLSCFKNSDNDEGSAEELFCLAITQAW